MRPITNLQGRMVRFSNQLASDIHRYVSWENLTRDQVAVELQVVVLVGKLSRSRELGELTPHHGPILLPPGQLAMFKSRWGWFRFVLQDKKKEVLPWKLDIISPSGRAKNCWVNWLNKIFYLPQVRSLPCLATNSGCCWWQLFDSLLTACWQLRNSLTKACWQLCGSMVTVWQN